MRGGFAGLPPARARGIRKDDMKDILITYLTAFDAEGYCLFDRIGAILAADCAQVAAWVASENVSAVCIATSGLMT
jgi:hypothetical protein